MLEHVSPEVALFLSPLNRYDPRQSENSEELVVHCGFMRDRQNDST